MFQTFWADMSGFMECVQEASSREGHAHQNPLGVFHIKLTKTAKALKSLV
jgi:hypothetical protein